MRILRSSGIVAFVIVAAVLATSCNPDHPPAAVAPCNVAIVGDSLIVGIEQGNRAVNQFAARGCGVSYIDARVGRPTSEGVSVIQTKAAWGQLPDILVVGLGTNDSANGAAFSQKIDQVMAAAGGRPVVWINVDRAATEAVLNATLQEAQLRYTNLWVLDWNTFADLNPHVRARDGIHLNSAGYDTRAAQLAQLVSGR